jgi:hypothetical protein
MIAYDLQCSNGHQFEGWFEDSHAFDRQKKARHDCLPGLRGHRRLQSALHVRHQRVARHGAFQAELDGGNGGPG